MVSLGNGEFERPTVGVEGKRLVDPCEFQARRIYRVSSRTVKATQRNPVFKKKKERKGKKKKENEKKKKTQK